MGCPPVRGDNPRALASGLSYVQVDKHGIAILYHLLQCRPWFSAKFGKGGINDIKQLPMAELFSFFTTFYVKWKQKNPATLVKKTIKIK